MTALAHNALECVVARYGEDVAWLAELGLPATIYDKSGEPPTLSPELRESCRIVPLPNTGRETHTYLYHIVNNYDALSDHTLFTQAHPFDHLQPGTGPRELREQVLALAARGVPFKGLAWFTLRCDRMGRPHDMFEESHKGKWAGWGRDIPVGEVYGKLFAGPVPERFHVRAPAGVFLARRDRIHTRPLAFYQQALNLVLADPRDERNTGHAFERLWYLILNGNTRLNRE